MIKDWLVNEEGFRSKPYLCTNNVLTFGHGLTFITEEESLYILDRRIESLSREVRKILNDRHISIDEFRFNILVDMSFQLGITGLNKFNKMFVALKNMDYDTASNEMLDSKWHKDTPNRCELQANRMKLGY